MDNLIRDVFLRKQMTPDGFVPASVVMGFHRVARMCPDAATMFEALADSTVVELNTAAQTLRPKEGWQRWPFPHDSDAAGVGQPTKDRAPAPASAPTAGSGSLLTSPVDISARPAPFEDAKTKAPMGMSPPGGSTTPPRRAAAAKKPTTTHGGGAASSSKEAAAATTAAAAAAAAADSTLSPDVKPFVPPSELASQMESLAL